MSQKHLSERSRNAAERMRELLLRPEFTAVGAAIVVITVFSIMSPLFLTIPTLASVSSVAAELGIVSIGMTILLIAGHFDLSVGAILGLTSFFVVTLMNDFGLSPVFAIFFAIAGACALGLVNGLLQTKTGIHSFIITLGTSLVYRGMLLAFTGGFPKSVDMPREVSNVIAGPILFGGMRMSLVWFILITVLATILLLRTRLGNWIQAVGQNAKAAHNLGVNVNRTTILAFTLSGGLAGIVGVMQAARFASVDAMRGTGIELQAVAVSVIGGTLLSGGYGSAIGAMMGAIVLASIQTGLVLVSAPGFLYTTIMGVIVVGAVLVNNWFSTLISRIAPMTVEEPEGDARQLIPPLQLIPPGAIESEASVTSQVKQEAQK
ncbi:ABC transporter permease (plasmid) [Agrobacterium tumefaciens]|uniref:ABC transporter permease n=1 Tax=Rhizobium/Agrobacterium group TaxID=227290 RepID=UPI0015744414|nr:MULTISPECIES: ABC transporter permease [Rhizobium/Agrobacterium group]NTI65921.1 ABC transporter permease [Rhizobium rhizogenes]UXS56268.1 ABC transporter permease [Agrobacterium tumefaciens]UXS66526.1 ABC transporter permease [Agrobacterium tumefaciens]UXS74153.1 ABC transporter permease [Agrobacterium tumefaciens]UXS81817.1 ABC transporter permease [Agrobacterium tumefaciens]